MNVKDRLEAARKEIVRRIANIDDSYDPPETQWEKAGFVEGLNAAISILDKAIGDIKGNMLTAEEDGVLCMYLARLVAFGDKGSSKVLADKLKFFSSEGGKDDTHQSMLNQEV